MHPLAKAAPYRFAQTQMRRACKQRMPRRSLRMCAVQPDDAFSFEADRFADRFSENRRRVLERKIDVEREIAVAVGLAGSAHRGEIVQTPVEQMRRDDIGEGVEDRFDAPRKLLLPR